jgi:hypothetical protein
MVVVDPVPDGAPDEADDGWGEVMGTSRRFRRFYQPFPVVWKC